MRLKEVITMTANLTGLSALITGAAGGIGEALTQAFHAAGARLTLVDIIDCSHRAKALGPEHSSKVLDLSNPQEIATVVDQIGRERGIDLLINNAGLGMVGLAEEQSVEDWDRTQNINMRAPWLMAKAAFPYLKASGRGRIINLASQAGVIALYEHVAYGASKAGLINVTKVIAVEWAKYGITANSISPTVVESPMALVGWSGEKGVKARQEIPVGRFAKPREIAAAALYLCSEDAAIVTGENLVMDGGYTVR
jgi:NAD(P)-dependent dehydrogenase (short-subunit alcohol dehydrogenase family)